MAAFGGKRGGGDQFESNAHRRASCWVFVFRFGGQINRGADVNATDIHGRTPLHWATVGFVCLFVCLFSCLLGRSFVHVYNAGSDVIFTDKNNLHLHDSFDCHSLVLIGRCHAKVVAALVKARSDPNARSLDGTVPLHEAWRAEEVRVRVSVCLCVCV